MKIKVLRKSRWDFPGEFPCFHVGTNVSMAAEEDDDFIGWFSCQIDGYETFVPKIFVEDGKLIREYNPTELTQQPGDILRVVEIVGAWLLATNENGVTGWIPAECVISV